MSITHYGRVDLMQFVDVRTTGGILLTFWPGPRNGERLTVRVHDADDFRGSGRIYIGGEIAPRRGWLERAWFRTDELESVDMCEGDWQVHRLLFQEGAA